MKKNKTGAMELSMGTLVVIVLAVSALILGIFFVQKIFSSGTNAVIEINAAIQREIDNLFSTGEAQKMVIYPKAREITLKQGDEGGFGLSIKNLEQNQGVFSYEVTAQELDSNCQMGREQAQQLIILGQRRENIPIASGNQLTNAILVKFKISETTPLCTIRYAVNVLKDGRAYDYADVDLRIKG